MARYWFQYDFDAVRGLTRDGMVCGWAFGETEAEAIADARGWAIHHHPRHKVLLLTAALSVRIDADWKPDHGPAFELSRPSAGKAQPATFHNNTLADGSRRAQGVLFAGSHSCLPGQGDLFA